MKDITNNTRKSVAALAEAKHRRRQGLFTAEGTKCVTDTLGHFRCEQLLATAEWFESHEKEAAHAAETIVCGKGDLRQMSTLQATPPVIAVYRLPEPREFDPEALSGSLVLALDRIQDPGNLGTIMRTADWMGIDTVLASIDTVDAFNPKTIQATMGAISRVSVIYGPLPDMLRRLGGPVYGMALDGESIYEAPLSATGAVVMGNEGAGLSEEVSACLTKRLLIPSYPAGRPTSESLNVASATAITLAEFRRRLL